MSDTDIRGYEDFVRRHSVSLVRTLTLILLDRAAAEDVAQEAFLKLYLNWDAVRTHPAPDSWLYRVAVNRATDYRRRLARWMRTAARLRETPNAAQSEVWEPSPEFLSAMHSLPQGQRTAAVLRYLLDMPVEEVAATMGISEGAVSSHLHRARKALSSTLEVRP